MQAVAAHERFAGKRVLLIVSGGIAAYKALELIRLLRGTGLRGHLRIDRGRRAVRHAAVAAGTEREQGLHATCSR